MEQQKQEFDKLKTFLAPMGDRILVEEDAFKYEGRIVIPDKAQRRPTTAKIIALGPDANNVRFRVGMRVLYAQLSGTLIEFRGKPAVRILHPDEILAEITSDETTLEYTAV